MPIEALQLQLPADRMTMTMPAAAPPNSSMHAIDWMKKPGNRFSTALL
jgi:hypothetical protein